MVKFFLVISTGFLAFFKPSVGQGSLLILSASPVWIVAKPIEINGLDSVPKKAAAPTAFAKGKALIAKSDCLACHREKEKLVGPGYTDVAKKYKPTKENIALLAGKVIAGGKGVWGEMPMTPHAALTPADAKEMITYILSLRTK